MGFLTDKDLACIREHVEETFQQTITVLHRTWSSDGMGGGTYTTTSSTYAAQVSPYLYGDSEQRNPASEQTQAVAPRTIYTVHNAVISPKDRIIWTGGTLEVIGTDHDRAIPITLSAVCREVGQV